MKLGFCIGYNGEGFFPLPAFSWSIGRSPTAADDRRDVTTVWVYITFSIAWGNRGLYLTYYRSYKAIKNAAEAMK